MGTRQENTRKPGASPRKAAKTLCPSHKFSGAFGLIELMIASLIFVTTGLYIMSLFLYALSINQQVKLDTTALNLSIQKIEELRSLPFNDPHLVSPGCSLDGAGEINFSGSCDSNHSLVQLLPLQIYQSTSTSFETRWHIDDIAGKKIITVATRAASIPLAHSHPIQLRLVRVP
jgi:hypothetical protein